MDIIVSIINASYEKVTFIGGLALIMVSIFCSRPVTVLKVKLPVIDNIGRSISGIVGLLLLLASLFIWLATANVGLFSTPPSNDNNVSLLQIIKSAYANTSERFTIQQYRPIKIKISSGEQLGVYADNIKPVKPSRIIIFKAEGMSYDFWGKKIDYESLKQRIGDNNIMFEASVTQKGKYSFLYSNKRYFLQVKEIFWYLFGSDYITIEVKN